jgi:hypothetical protein
MRRKMTRTGKIRVPSSRAPSRGKSSGCCGSTSSCVQRCRCCLFRFGAHALVVLSRTDGKAVDWMEQGFFCKLGNTQTANRQPLYVP